MKTIIVIISMFLLALSVETSFAGEISLNNFQPDSNITFNSLRANQPEKKKKAFALKSNLLYWAAATPNLSIEYYLSSRFSFNTELAFAWWSDKNASFYWQIFAVTPELRYWFSHEYPFKGHYMGVYMSGGLYDVMFKPLTGDKGYQGKFYTAAGISYGYVFPIGKGFSLELGVGIGYMATQYHEYVRSCSDFMRTNTKRTTWIGPTKINLMFVWQIPR